jgi:hypothetical protein
LPVTLGSSLATRISSPVVKIVYPIVSVSPGSAWGRPHRSITTFQIAARRVGSPHAMLMLPPGLPSGRHRFRTCGLCRVNASMAVP